MTSFGDFEVSNIAVGVLGICLLGFIYRYLRSNTSLPLPPGPKRLLLIENLLDLPKGPEWLHWAKHKEIYGSLSSVSFLGTNIIILNDFKVVTDLLDKRGSIYSDRPELFFTKTMCGWGLSFGLLEYGDRHREMRKCASKTLSSRAALARFLPTVEVEALRTLLRVLVAPEKVLEHVRTFGGAVIIGVTYGYTIEPWLPDPLVRLIDKSLGQFMDSASPGRWLVDSFHILRFFPDWMPGTGFKKVAREYTKVANATADIPFDFVKHQMVEGTAPPTIVSMLLQQNPSADEETTIKWAAQAMYLAGSDTSVIAIQNFLLAMLHFPEVLNRAQAEMDAVIGSDRLPTFADRQELSYVNAVVKETFRWGCIAPTSLPRATTTDDVYKGYLIPKGSIIVTNIWQLLHDPDYYKDPMAFNPERFLGETPEMDPKELVFGFGRRICVGKDLADHLVFLSVSHLLAVFNIARAKNEKGYEIVPPTEWTPGTASHPKDFALTISPRSDKAVALIRSVEVNHPFMPSDLGTLVKLGFDSSMVEGVKKG